MKKFLLILIIAVIACVEVEEKVQKENELEVIHHDFLDSIDFEDPNIVELHQSYRIIYAKLTALIKTGNIQGKDIFEKVKDVLEKGKDILKDFNEFELAPDTLKKEGVWDSIVQSVQRDDRSDGFVKCLNIYNAINCILLFDIIDEIISK